MKRDEFVKELLLREHIRKILEVQDQVREKESLEERQLREYIRELIMEVEVEDEIPHHNTGINVLEELLKKIMPTVEDGYKALTSDYMQRKSYRAHIVNAIQNLLLPEKVITSAPGQDSKEAEQAIVGVDEGIVEEVDMIVGDEGVPEDNVEPDEFSSEPEAAKKFLDIEKTGRKQRKIDTFTLPGHDMTGRNMALQIFEKVEKQILDSYSILNDEEDRSIFSDYLLTNVKLYMDKFEDELLPAVEEPTSDEYEKAVDEKEPDLTADVEI